MSRAVFVALFAVAGALAAPFVELPDVTQPAALQIAFKNFQKAFDKSYDPSEMKEKFMNFKDNVMSAIDHNKRFPEGSVHGITMFSDMSAEDFQNTILMKNGIKTVSRDEALKIRAANENAKQALLKRQTLPTNFDWRFVKNSPVTAVKNQGQCGSCWAFSATENIESVWILAGKGTNENVNLAPQQIVDCDYNDAGCNGGETETAFQYIIDAGGQESNESYPYTAEDGNCMFNAKKIVASISTYNAATEWFSETTLQQNLVNWAPLSICVDASAWQTYQSGVMTWEECAWINELDHCVQLVGYNQSASTPYWVVRNSWTADWGIDGYIWLEMWEDTCGVAHDANSAVAST